MNRYAWLATIVLVTVLGRGCSNKADGDHSSPNRAYASQARSDAAPGKPIPRVKIIPWVEDNYAQYDDRVVEGLRIWRKVADTAIVSTMPGRAALYPKLRERVPGMRIIPGLKTMDLLPRFDSVKGWRRVAEEVSAILAAGGERVVLLENEVAIKAFVDGAQPLNLDRLRQGLALLPGDVAYLWYPSIYGHEQDKRSRCAEVCRVVAETLLNVRLLDQRYQGRRAVSDRARIAADAILKSISRRPTLPMLYFYGSEHSYTFWRDEQVHEALGYVRKDWGDEADVVLYPGLKRWVEAARSLSQRLSAVRPPERP